MITNNIQILNLSCKGCVNTITRNLMSIEGVNEVSVNLETSTVQVQHEEHVLREKLLQVLLSLGYPEVNMSNKLITKIKSKKSCIIGRMS